MVDSENRNPGNTGKIRRIMLFVPQIAKEMIHMEQEYGLLPFRDPQQRTLPRTCPVCGREIYGVGGQCIYCARFPA